MPEVTQTADAAVATTSAAEQTGAITFAPPTAPTLDGPATASLQYGDKQLELKVIPATEGAPGMDISKLLTTFGAITLDPGFTNTGSTTSAVTYIDGDAGILRYRGYPIEQLAEKSTFVETSYLLIYGELPSPEQLADFDARIRRHTLLHEDLKGFFRGFPRDARRASGHGDVPDSAPRPTCSDARARRHRLRR